MFESGHIDTRECGENTECLRHSFRQSCASYSYSFTLRQQEAPSPCPCTFHSTPRSKCFFSFVQDGLVQLKKLTSWCHANGFAGSNDLCRCPANRTHILKCPKILSSHPFYQRFLGTSWESCLAPKHSARLRDCDLWLPWSLVQQSAIPRASESASRTDLP